MPISERGAVAVVDDDDGVRDALRFVLEAAASRCAATPRRWRSCRRRSSAAGATWWSISTCPRSPAWNWWRGCAAAQPGATLLINRFALRRPDRPGGGTRRRRRAGEAAGERRSCCVTSQPEAAHIRRIFQNTGEPSSIPVRSARYAVGVNHLAKRMYGTSWNACCWICSAICFCNARSGRAQPLVAQFLDPWARRPTGRGRRVAAVAAQEHVDRGDWPGRGPASLVLEHAPAA